MSNVIRLPDHVDSEPDRDAGEGYDIDRRCETCHKLECGAGEGVLSLDPQHPMRKWVVCDDCGNCGECGHDEECPRRVLLGDDPQNMPPLVLDYWTGHSVGFLARDYDCTTAEVEQRIRDFTNGGVS